MTSKKKKEEEKVSFHQFGRLSPRNTFGRSIKNEENVGKNKDNNNVNVNVNVDMQNLGRLSPRNTFGRSVSANLKDFGNEKDDDENDKNKKDDGDDGDSDRDADIMKEEREIEELEQVQIHEEIQKDMEQHEKDEEEKQKLQRLNSNFQSLAALDMHADNSKFANDKNHNNNDLAAAAAASSLTIATSSQANHPFDVARQETLFDLPVRNKAVVKFVTFQKMMNKSRADNNTSKGIVTRKPKVIPNTKIGGLLFGTQQQQGSQYSSNYNLPRDANNDFVAPSTVASDSEAGLPSGDDTTIIEVSQTKKESAWRTAYLTFQTLGIIYGDLGTSPLYTFSTVFITRPVKEDVMGALSLMIWTLFLTFIVKYVVFVLNADDHGEGGTFALFSKLRRSLLTNMKHTPLSEQKSRWYRFQRFLIYFTPLVSALGVAAILSDGILTPAISVLGAVQGLTIISPNISQSVVVGVTCAILVVLYMIQHYGTGAITKVFSPILFFWFITLVIIGVNNIIAYPAVLKAFNPAYGFEFFIRKKKEGWTSLGAIFLTVTGSEALYADLGHFNANSIRISALFIVLPSLLICYCGQGARLIVEPDTYQETFYRAMPKSVVAPMVILSTFAAIIASQAIITATFSLISQATQLGFFPRLTVKYTSKRIEGRVYIPEVNYAYMFLVIAVVAGYRNATALGYAYGVAVSLLFFLTTILYSLAIIECYHLPWPLALLFFLLYALIDVSFLSANLLKFVTGGWFTVMITIIVAASMIIWRAGRLEMLKVQNEESESIQALIQDPESVHTPETRNCGTLICYTSNLRKLPLAYMKLRDNFSIKPEQFVFLAIKPSTSPFVLPNATATQLTANTFLVMIEYGYCNNIPTYDTINSVVTQVLETRGLRFSDNVIHLVGVDRIHIDANAPLYRKAFFLLFKTLQGVSTSVIRSFKLPINQTVAIENIVNMK